MSEVRDTPKKPRYLDEAWPERWFFPHAHRLPMRMRTWPWFEKFYWKQEELDAAHAEAERIADALGIK